DSPSEARFRSEVRSFIRAHYPSADGNSDSSVPNEDVLDSWRAALAARGWTVPHWPREYGGAGLSIAEQVVCAEEMAKARVPALGNAQGTQMIGPILQLYGTDQQKRKHLRAIATLQV